jgi:hypothetical protein
MTTAIPTASTRRSRVILTLRGAMTLVLLVALGLGGMIHHARVQRRAIAAIERAGGEVGFDFQQFIHGGTPPPEQPPGPRWLRSLIGDEWFRSVVHVRLEGTLADDEVLAQVVHFPRLERLEVARTRVTDAGLRHIRGLIHLTELDLCDTGVGDAGLVNLEALTSLKDLLLHGTSIGDEGLHHLRNLVKLEWLVLSKTRVSDAGLSDLGNLRSLTQLSLEETRVTGVGLISLGGLKSLALVTLSRPAYEKSQDLRKIRPDIEINFYEPYEEAGPVPNK